MTKHFHTALDLWRHPAAVEVEQRIAFRARPTQATDADVAEAIAETETAE